ncbi:MAG: hypothetical protein JXA37_03015 [Chloroflexia bacterium]|nr:hypothetical protein [Chloroflexia bacterium]
MTEREAGIGQIESAWRGRRWWVLGGGILLGLLVLAAVFSLGVYVGRRGWDAGAPSIARPGPAQPPLNPPQPIDQGWPQQQQPVLMGPLHSQNRQGLTVRTSDGLRFVRVTEETRFFRMEEGTEVEIDRQGLRPGDGVAVFGRPSPDGLSLLVERVVLLPPKQ